MKESLDRWLTTPPEERHNYMAMDDDALNEWGMAFINRIDAIINESDDDKEEVKDAWMNGDADKVLDEITVKEFLTEEQYEWVEQFLSEI